MLNPVYTSSNSDLELVKLAREIAMDIQPLQAILKQYHISEEQWAELQRSPRFTMLLASEVEVWNTALNTHERVRVKAGAMMEEWLPTLYTRMNDAEETLPAITEAAKMLSRIAGMGLPTDLTGAIGERFTVTINLGPQVAPLEFTKEVTSKVIDHDTINTVKPHESN